MLNQPDPPTAASDGSAVINGEGPARIDVLANDTHLPDPPETLTITSVTQAANGQVAIVGGGAPARRDIAKARTQGVTWAGCDHIGILATRENAIALGEYLGNLWDGTIPESLHQAQSLFGKGVLVMGGTEPGHSTDAVACLLADWVGADIFVNASNVDAVYDMNPKEHPDAKPLAIVSASDLSKILSGAGSKAGQYPLLDHVAIQTIKRAGFSALMVDGRDLANMEDAVLGRPFKGTRVTPD